MNDIEEKNLQGPADVVYLVGRRPRYDGRLVRRLDSAHVVGGARGAGEDIGLGLVVAADLRADKGLGVEAREEDGDDVFGDCGGSEGGKEEQLAGHCG